jgi:methionyl-tRNA formyltransferase
VAYGALVPQAALDVPPEGWVNLHFSLLPAWRGAAPVQRAIIAGDDITGATTFRLEKGLDTGPVFGVVTVGVGPRDTAGDLLDRLAVDGAGLLTATLDGIEDGTLSAVPQPSDGVSLAPKLTVDDARIEWSATAVAIDRLVRGCTPAPGAWTTLGEQRLGVGPVQPVAADDVGDDPLAPGDLRIDRREVLVGTGTGPVRLGELRPPGRAAMAAVDWARGLRLDAGARLQ